MAKFILASDTKLQCSVALRILPAEVAVDRNRTNRRVQEAKLSARQQLMSPVFAREKNRLSRHRVSRFRGGSLLVFISSAAQNAERVCRDVVQLFATGLRGECRLEGTCKCRKDRGCDSASSQFHFQKSNLYYRRRA